MRILYLYVHVAIDEVSFIEQGDRSAPGRVRVKSSLRDAASILSIWTDLLATRDDVYLYMAAALTGGTELSRGLYEDVDRPRLGWIFFPKAPLSLVEHGMVETAGYDEVLSLFLDRGKSRGPRLPLDIVTGLFPHAVRRFSLMLSTRLRRVPGVVRHESGYDANGNVADSWGKRDARPLFREDMCAASLGVWHAFPSSAGQSHYLDLFIRPMLRASAMNDFMGRTRTINNPIDTHRCAALAGNDMDRGRVVGSFLRPTAAKGVPEVLELYRDLLALGRVDRAVVTWNYPTPCPYETLEAHPACGRDEWLQHAGRVTAAVFNSQGESSPTCMIEAMSAGVIPVLPRRQEWVRCLRFFSDWPWLYDSLDEIPNLLEAIWPVAPAWCAKSREIAMSMYDSRRLGTELLDFYRHALAESCKFVRMDEAALAAWADGSKLADAVRALQAQEVGWTEIMTKVVLPRDRMGRLVVASHNDLPWLLRRLARYADSCDSFTPNYRRTP